MYRVELHEPDEEDAPWTVLFIPYMPADDDDICDVETHLAEVAASFHGKVTGWGCVARGVA